MIRKVAVGACAVILILLALAVLALYEPAPDGDAPLVVVSVDRSLWNRVGLNRLTYVRALRRAGLRPVLVDADALVGNAQGLADLVADASGLILSGGGDVAAALYGGDPSVERDVDPERDRLELELLAAAERRSLPILGLCRGAQLINVHRGGTLGDMRHDGERYARHKRIRPGHAITLDPDSRLARLFETTRLDSVVTWHGQYVDVPGDGVRIVGHSPDGTPEAIEVGGGEGFGIVGVQWHAEVLPWDSNQARLFEAFAAAAAAHQRNEVQ